MAQVARLGQLIEDGERRRDAIHVAIAPVTAAQRLVPGQHVGLVREGNVELDRPGRDMETLRQWASLTGGVAVKAEECRDASTLIETIREHAASRELNRKGAQSTSLGTNWITLLLLLGLIGTEWALRKRWDWM